MSTIAIDFDDTFTDDMGLWSGFIQAAWRAGHSVTCVTARRDTPENADYIGLMFKTWQCEVPIVFTDGAAKLGAVKGLGIAVDIWIDDNPAALVNGL